jgi:hypothetical protein
LDPDCIERKKAVRLGGSFRVDWDDLRSSAPRWGDLSVPYLLYVRRLIPFHSTDPKQAAGGPVVLGKGTSIGGHGRNRTAASLAEVLLNLENLEAGGKAVLVALALSI